MPTYQYACTECGHEFEAVQSFTDDALTECPACGGRLRKVFNAVGIVFKGSGFYRNDSREARKGKSRRQEQGVQGRSGKSDVVLGQVRDKRRTTRRQPGQEVRQRGSSGSTPARRDSGSSGSGGLVRRQPRRRPQRAAPPEPAVGCGRRPAVPARH